MTKFRALLVDDERLARGDLRTCLHAFPEIEIVGEAASAAEAVARVEALRPDVVFLDVQLPDGLGFDVIERLGAVPHLVFVTGHDAYALRAFEVNALDYVLKPVETPRLAEAIRRLGVARGWSETPRPFAPSDRCYLEVGAFKGFIALTHLVRLETTGNYTTLHLRDRRRFEVKQSLQQWEARLPREQFIRINRNELVQIAAVTALLPTVTGGLAVHLAGTAEPREVSRRAAPGVKACLGAHTR